MKKHILTLFLFALSFQWLDAQYKLGQWVDYLPYNSVVSVTRGNGKVYAATGGSVFAVNWTDNSFERLNKTHGLSDVGATIVRYNEFNGTLIIVYSNSNIDVIKNGVVINFSDIERKNITAAKTVNHISFYKHLAYLATGFGVVVFDTDKLEFKDTYVTGTNGTYQNIFDVARDDNYIYAGTSQGLKRAAVTANLSDFQNWTVIPDLPAKTFNCVARFNNFIIANYSAKIHSNQSHRDTVYYFDGSVWAKFPAFEVDSNSTYEITRIVGDETYQRLMMTDQWSVNEWWYTGSGWTRPYYFGVYNYPDPNGNPVWPVMTEGVYAPGFGYEQHIVGSAAIGLFKSNFFNYEHLHIDGPFTNRVSQIAILEDKMLIAPVYLTEVWTNNYVKSGIYVNENGSWNNIRKYPMDSVFDINCVAFYKGNTDHYFAGSWGNGLMEFRSDTLYKIYNNFNSSLKAATTTTNLVRTNGIVSDSSGNLWVSNAFTTYAMSVMKPDGQWQAFSFANYVPNNMPAGKVIIDQNNQKWILLPTVGFLVYNDGGTYAQPNASNTKKITTAANSGGLPSAQVFSICEDKEGDIWVGTDKGVAVFYNPESILSSSSGWDAQQIIIEENGVAKILLESETVLDIAVDGLNRKWAATKTGVYCFSADGQKQIYHFTAENSPLFSNNVLDIEYNGKTGDMFFGTIEGLQSFRSDVIDPFEFFTDVYSYPNPVRPGYEGPVVIKGMVENTVVKIADITGTLVYETTSKGGQAVWNVKNFNGDRVASGVYVVFCASSDGEQKTLTKILVVN